MAFDTDRCRQLGIQCRKTELNVSLMTNSNAMHYAAKEKTRKNLQLLSSSWMTGCCLWRTVHNVELLAS